MAQTTTTTTTIAATTTTKTVEIQDASQDKSWFRQQRHLATAKENKGKALPLRDSIVCDKKKSGWLKNQQHKTKKEISTIYFHFILL